MKKTFSLASNRGDFQTAWTAEYESADLILGVVVERAFLDRAQLPSKAQSVADAAISLHQVVCSRDRLRDLRVCLGEWLTSRKLLSVDLADTPDQFLRVSLRLRDDLICSVEKPVFEIEHDAGIALHVNVAFVVDQSCIQVMHDELCQVLEPT